jgi:hypothetical protein
MQAKFKTGDLAWLKPSHENFNVPLGALVEVLNTDNGNMFNIRIKLVLCPGDLTNYWVSANMLKKIELNAESA